MQEESAEEQALQALFHFIETKGLRKTQERETVLRTIYNMKDKVSIEEILSSIRNFFLKYIYAGLLYIIVLISCLKPM